MRPGIFHVPVKTVSICRSTILLVHWALLTLVVSVLNMLKSNKFSPEKVIPGLESL